MSDRDKIKVGQHFITAEGKVVKAIQDNGSNGVDACEGCLFNDERKRIGYCSLEEQIPHDQRECAVTIFVEVTDDT